MDEGDTQTVPVDNTYREVFLLHNREFQRYAVENGVHFSPVDDVSAPSFDRETSRSDDDLVSKQEEIERLQYMHGMFNLMFENRLIFPPIPRPRRILECGSGSGGWAAQVAEQYPECEVGGSFLWAPFVFPNAPRWRDITISNQVLLQRYCYPDMVDWKRAPSETVEKQEPGSCVIGIDIFPYMVAEDMPANLEFQVDDLNSPFTFQSNYFDLVHSRMMAGGINTNRWPSYMTDILRVLRPGGWCQMVEIYFNAQSDNGTLTANHALQVWSQNYMQSVSAYKDPRAPMRLENWMRQAGFVEVEARLLTLPLTGWSNDPRDNAIGTANRANVHRLLSSLALYPFTQALGMTNNEVQLLVAQARAEADNPAYRAYFPVYVCIGRKPGGSRSSRPDSYRSQTPSKSGRHSDSRKRVRR
ncbi:S-adenosyl-L-methionine-dependent methyltransferase [Cercophora newfieldiana]|uniref:S-adenosyl-L-methionine-dependent methyltransferase n=1 Tax=Cercophora newfieldiana TaxID=92897 RepID=A0AA40CM31_9PEZI|nr:S-adenosyl-L-methionine-dependent methyltransferase [Cercophora newfieldiana]